MSTNTLAKYPLVYATTPVVRLAIAYNPFDHTDITKHELEYDQNKTLADYLEGLPEEVTWSVGLDGKVIEKDDWASVTPKMGSTIVLVRIPEGGKAAKNVLRIVALITLAFFAPQLAAAWLPGSIGSLTVTTSVINAAAGAITVAGGMLINALLPVTPANVGSPNRQPVTESYGIDGPKNTAREGVVRPRVYGEYRVGGNIIDCYTKNVGDDQYLYIRTLLNDGEVAAVTDIEINNQPLASFKDIETRIHLGREDDEDDDWFEDAVRLSNRGVKIGNIDNLTRHITDGPCDRLRADFVFPNGLIQVDDKGNEGVAGVELAICYRPVDDDGNPIGDGHITPIPLAEGSAPFVTTRTSHKAVRVTYETTPLPRSRYELVIWRSPDESTDLQLQDAVFLSDVGEIDDDNLQYKDAAKLSLKIKLNDQLSGIPTVTALVKGSVLDIYNEDGEVVDRRWSNNPAHIISDILHNPIQGCGYPTYRTLWARMVEFAEFCDAEEFEFNGVFDQVFSVWDAVQAVARVGRATIIPQGTRFSVAIDRPAEPVMLFTGSNIYEGSFAKTWSGRNDRANEIQLEFQDAGDGFKQRTVRIPNQAAQARGERAKPASSPGFGITKQAQAIKEAEYQARQNSYINNSLTFDAPIEAIGLTIGDVALVQHDSVKYADGAGGRLEAGCTTSSLVLDRPVNMEDGKEYAVLVTYDALERGFIDINDISGSVITAYSSSDTTDVRRIVQGDADVAILSIKPINGGYRIVVDDASELSLGTAFLWQTDVIEERDVVYAEGEHQTVSLAEPLSSAPPQYANFMFGERSIAKLPYRLRKVSATEDLYRRTLSFSQYDERVYHPGSWGSPDIANPPTWTIGQVRSLAAEFDRAPPPEQQRLTVRLSWTKPTKSKYGGADVYFRRTRPEDEDQEEWTVVGSAVDVTTFSQDFNRGDKLTFKVVAFDKDGNRAIFEEAPTVDADLAVFSVSLPPPTSFTHDTPVWKTDATVGFSWVAPEGIEPPIRYVLSRKRIDYADYQAVVTAGDDPADWPGEVIEDDGWQIVTDTTDTKASVDKFGANTYIMRLRAIKGFSVSPWVYDPIDVESPEFAFHIRNLRLNGGDPDVESDTFSGPDANWTWDDILTSANVDGENVPHQWQDYRVLIYDLDDNLLRTEYVSHPAYSYTYGKNAADAKALSVRARREFRIEVRVRGKLNQLSQPATMTASNPAPAAPTGVTSVADMNAISVSWDSCPDLDYAGTVVWVGESTGFLPSPSNEGWRGRADRTRIPVSETKQYYVRVGHYDTFDDIPENISTEDDTFVPTLAIEELTEISEMGSAILGELPALHELADANAAAALQNALKGVKDRTSSEVQDELLQTLQTLQGTALGTQISEEKIERINGDTAVAGTISLIGAKSGNGLAFEVNLATFKVSPTESLGTRLTNLAASTGDVLAQLTTETTARTTADSAAASQISSLGSRVGSAESAITSNYNTLANADSALSSLITSLASRVGTAEASITSNYNTLVNADAALASFQTLLGSKNGDGSAIILNTGTVRVTPSQSFSEWKTAQDAVYGNAVLYANNAISLNTGPASTIGQQITGLGLQIDGVSANVTTLSSVVSGPGGLTAKYGVALNVNGHIVGFTANNNGVSGDFVIVADRFAVVTGSGGTPKTPFSIVGNTIRMTNVEVDTLVVGAASTRAITRHPIQAVVGTTPVELAAAASNYTKTRDVKIFAQCTFSVPAGETYGMYLRIERTQDGVNFTGIEDHDYTAFASSNMSPVIISVDKNVPPGPFTYRVVAAKHSGATGTILKQSATLIVEESYA